MKVHTPAVSHWDVLISEVWGSTASSASGSGDSPASWKVRVRWPLQRMQPVPQCFYYLCWLGVWVCIHEISQRYSVLHTYSTSVHVQLNEGRNSVSHVDMFVEWCLSSVLYGYTMPLMHISGSSGDWRQWASFVIPIDHSYVRTVCSTTIWTIFPTTNDH